MVAGIATSGAGTGGPTLKDFGLTPAVLRQIVSEAHAQTIPLGAAAPRGGRGLVFYIFFVSGLRSHLNSQGWKNRPIGGIEFVEHPTLPIRLAYCKGGSGTGLEDEELKSAHPRGPAGQQSASMNAQLALSYPLKSFQPTAPQRATHQEWYVLVYREPGSKRYRLEIALPVAVEDGFYSGWAQRIPLGEVTISTKLKFNPAPTSQVAPTADAATPSAAPPSVESTATNSDDAARTPTVRRRRATPNDTDPINKKTDSSG